MMISTRKQVVEVSRALRGYLGRHGREVSLPLMYEDLLRYGDTTPVYDKRGRDTLWETVLYPASERRTIYEQLVETYAILKVKGDASLMRHLVTDRVDVCSFGNTQPFRVRILNTLNENFDYFYVKRADASRVYGLELEHILSPNRIAYLSCANTLVEEHISGSLFEDAALQSSALLSWLEVPGTAFYLGYTETAALAPYLASERVVFAKASVLLRP